MSANLLERGKEHLRDVLSMGTRRRIAWSRVALRRYTGRYRMLPNLLIIGAQRCGTSSLYKYLGRHPEVAASLRKEIRYFTAYFDKGEDWYRAHFPLTISASGVRVAFEASPDYLLDPRCAERAAELVADSRIVVMLRDPVERAFSQYLHNRRLGLEPLSFEEALEREEDRLAPHRAALEQNPAAAVSNEYYRFSYVTRGLYAEQLELWLARFPAQSVMVVHSEDLFSRPVDVFGELTGFLGVSPWLPDEFRNYSYVGGPPASRKGAEMDAATRQKLEERFREPNRQLARLIDRSFEWS